MSTCSLRFPTSLSNFLILSGVAHNMPDWSMSTNKDRICLNLVWKTNTTNNLLPVPPNLYRSNPAPHYTSHCTMPNQRQYSRNMQNTGKSKHLPPRFAVNTCKVSSFSHNNTNISTNNYNDTDTQTVINDMSDTSDRLIKVDSTIDTSCDYYSSLSDNKYSLPSKSSHTSVDNNVDTHNSSEPKHIETHNLPELDVSNHTISDNHDNLFDINIPASYDISVNSNYENIVSGISSPPSKDSLVLLEDDTHDRIESHNNIPVLEDSDHIINHSLDSLYDIACITPATCDIRDNSLFSNNEVHCSLSAVNSSNFTSFIDDTSDNTSECSIGSNDDILKINTVSDQNVLEFDIMNNSDEFPNHTINTSQCSMKATEQSLNHNCSCEITVSTNNINSSVVASSINICEADITTNNIDISNVCPDSAIGEKEENIHGMDNEYSSGVTSSSCLTNIGDSSSNSVCTGNINKPVRCLTEDEDRESLESWIPEVTKHLSQFNCFRHFLDDSCTWDVYNKRNPNRGLSDDDSPASLKITHLNMMLHEIASLVPAIDSRYMNKKATSLKSVWSMIFQYYQCY